MCAEAVRVALTGGPPRKQVAADFGVGFSTLSRRFQQDRRDPEKSSAKSDLECEVAKLRKENWTGHAFHQWPLWGGQLRCGDSVSVWARKCCVSEVPKPNDRKVPQERTLH